MNETIALFVITAIVWIIFDIYIIKKKGKSESISAHVIRFIYKHFHNTNQVYIYHKFDENSQQLKPERTAAQVHGV